jgi:hypothetical protein
MLQLESFAIGGTFAALEGTCSIRSGREFKLRVVILLCQSNHRQVLPPGMG